MKEIAPNIIVDPSIRSGKPVLKGTTVTVEEVLNWLIKRVKYKDITKEYGLKEKEVVSALDYASGCLRNTQGELGGAQYIRELRANNWQRSREKVGEAMDALFRIPKEKWPKLLKE